MLDDSLPFGRQAGEEALAAADRGWQVIPLHSMSSGECTCRREKCCSAGKHPLSKGWPKKGTTDPARVEMRFSRDLNLKGIGACMWIPVGPPTMPNLGILTGSPSRVVVLDIDPRNGGDESLIDLEKEHGRLPDTAMVLTGGGGWHYYFGIPDGLVLPGDELAPGVDLKAERGFVVGPGSLHRSGGTYQWELSSHPDDVGVADAPKWLVNKARRTLKRPRSPYYQPRTLPRRASSARQERFRELWMKVGVTIDPVREDFYVCPFHDDHDPSLHIDPVCAVWYCFGCHAQGGLRDLEGQLSAQVVMRQKWGITSYADISPLHPHPMSSTWANAAPPGDRCDGFRQLLQNRVDPERHLGIGLLCGEWDCFVCGPWLKKVWYDHLLECVMRSHDSLQLVLASPDEWRNLVAKAVQRDPAGRRDFVHFDFAGADVPLGETTSVVITTASMGITIKGPEVMGLIHDLLRCLPFDWARVSASTAWQRANTEPQHSGSWKRAAPIIGSLRASAAAAASLGLYPTPVVPLKADKKQQPWAESFMVDIPPEMRSNGWAWQAYMGTLAWGVDPDQVEREETARLKALVERLRGDQAS